MNAATDSPTITSVKGGAAIPASVDRAPSAVIAALRKISGEMAEEVRAADMAMAADAARDSDDTFAMTKGELSLMLVRASLMDAIYYAKDVHGQRFTTAREVMLLDTFTKFLVNRTAG